MTKYFSLQRNMTIGYVKTLKDMGGLFWEDISKSFSFFLKSL